MTALRRALRSLVGPAPTPPDLVGPRLDQLGAELGWRLADMRLEVDATRYAVGALEARLAAAHPPASLRDAEFKVFSQWGEDGIIQHLIRSVDCRGAETFVEIGVEDYRESNTRFLLVHDDWRGVIVDRDPAHDRFVTDAQLKWRHDITPITAFVTAESVNDVLEPHVSGDIGLLSLDIDGNDYWVLEALDVVRPRILVVEYNSVFGPTARISVPYDPAFDITTAHPSQLYFGASLAALAGLASSKGYALVGSSSAGVNAFFVRRDVLGGLPALDPADAWVASRFRASRGADGQLSYVGPHHDRLALIADMPAVVVPEGTTTTVGAAVAG